MKLHLLSGFLGSGKTTAIQQACRVLRQRGTSIGVITNDQGIKLVDEGFFSSLSIPNRQVGNGCFCCNFKELNDRIQSLITSNKPSVVFAESVGSCTDMMATVLKPLQVYRADITVTFSVFADVRLLQLILNEQPFFDESVTYIYKKQLEEAGILIINKTDLIDAEELDKIKILIDQKYPEKQIIYQQSLTPDGINEWLHLLDNFTGYQQLPSLEIDYDIYGNGEAKLAWFDDLLTIQATAGNALQCADYLLNNIYTKIKEQQLPIGHLKFLIDDTIKISITALSLKNDPIHLSSTAAERVTILINARVQTAPNLLSKIIDESIKQTEKVTFCSILQNGRASFKPSYPTPSYRITQSVYDTIKEPAR